MNTSEILNKAADLIEERGWVGIDRDLGGDLWGGGASSDAPVCIEGGIVAAMGWDYEALGDIAGDLNACPAYVAVQEHLNTRYDGGPGGREAAPNRSGDRR